MMNRFMQRALVVLALSGCAAMTAACAAAQESTPHSGKAALPGVTIPTDCGTLSLVAMTENAIRVRCAPTLADDRQDLVFLNGAASVPARLQRTPGEVRLATSQIAAVLNRRTGVLRFTDAAGHTLLEETAHSRSVQPSTILGQPTLTAGEQFHSPEGEHLFGSGQFQDGFLDIRDLPRRLTQVNTQISIPFFVSSQGYGLLWHNLGRTDLNPAGNRLVLQRENSGTTTTAAVTTAAGTHEVQRTEASFTGEFSTAQPGRFAMMLDIGQTMAQRYHVEIDGKTVVDFSNRWLPPTTSWFAELPAGQHRVRVLGEAQDQPAILWRPSEDATTLRSPVSEGLDYVVIAGPSADRIIATYRDLTGQATLLPDWAYGFIQCRERYHSSQEILDNAREFRAQDLPMDVMVQDWQYWGKYGWNAMRWDEDYYPDPAALVRDLHALHAKLMVSVWSAINKQSEVGKQFVARNMYIAGTDWIDFLNPAARELYWKNFSSRMLSLGIDAWWLDATEPENDALAGKMTAAGPGDRFRLIYPLLVTRTVYEGQRRDAPDRRVFILTRSAFLGEQRYAAATWSGDVGSDWETLRRQITGGLDYTVAGMPYWTTDTGGFFRPGKSQYTDPKYHELYLRWLQYSTFTPLMRVHGFQTDTEPWHFGDAVLAEQRQYLDLRYRLLPYLYSQAAAVTFKGSTLMRPLVMDFRTDPKALDQRYEFLFGPSMLVAPVVQPGVARWPVYLPATPGGWYDWWTEAHQTGGQMVEVDSPLSHIPLMVRAGSIVPLGPVEQYTGQDTSGRLEVRVYPGADADFSLYEDEGVNYNYEKGVRATIPMHWNDRRHTLTVGARSGSYPGMKSTRELLIHLAGTDPSTDRHVVYGGRELSVPLPGN